MRIAIVHDMNPGDRLPSLRGLARQFRVSVTTMQAAAAVLRQRGIVVSRKGSGVYVADRSRGGRIGILSELDLLDPRIGHHFRAVAGALKSQLEAAGARPQFYVGNAEPGFGTSDEPTCRQFWADVEAGRLDGAVILDVPSTKAWQTRIRACPIPAVGAMTPFTAGLDTAGIVTAAVRALAGRGCTRLGLLAWHSGTLFRRAASECGVVTDDAWIHDGLDPAQRGAGWDEFRQIWSAPGKPDGLVILDDMLFADAQLAMMGLGVRVPEDLQLAVLTSRGAPAPHRLPVTAIEIDPAELAAALADMMMKRLRGETPEPRTKCISFRKIAPQFVNEAREVHTEATVAN